MQLTAVMIDPQGTELLDVAVPQGHRRDALREFYLATETVYTPLGLPLSFEIDIGPKGRRLTVRSADAVLLSVSSFDVYHQVRLRLPTDEVVRIDLYDR